MAVAARYLPVQRLIGGPWIALYWLVLRLSLAAALTVLVARIVLAAALPDISGESVAGMLFQFPGVVLMVFAWVTLSFALIDYFSAKLHWIEKSSWDPRKLPQIKFAMQPLQIKPLAHLAGLAVSLVFVVAARGWRSFVPASLLPHFQFSPAWHTAWVIMLVMTLLGLLSAFVVVLRPDWHGLHSLTDLVVAALGLSALAILMHGGPWIWLANPTHDAARYGHLVTTANLAVQWSIWGTMVGYGIAFLFNAWRCVMLWRTTSGRVPPVEQVRHG